VIDYTQEDFTQNGKQYDLILDAQGFRSMFDYNRALNPEGTYAMVGGAVPRMFQALFLGLCLRMTGSKKFRLVAEGPGKGLADLKELIEAGKVVPIVDRTFQLSEVPEAFRYFGEGRHKGKVAIAMESQLTATGQ
jgi:NADPH:quinone reductase-like Zn-dependent oxidoreductase